MEHRPRILVVDDHPDEAEVVSRALTAAGYDVLAVHDGSHAFRAARAFEPDVVLLDIGLPDMSGLEVAKWLRAGLTTSKTVIIATSGYTPDLLSTPALEKADFDYYLVKPIDIGELLAILTRIADMPIGASVMRLSSPASASARK